jgi:hypothetical protein
MRETHCRISRLVSSFVRQSRPGALGYVVVLRNYDGEKNTVREAGFSSLARSYNLPAIRRSGLRVAKDLAYTGVPGGRAIIAELFHPIEMRFRADSTFHWLQNPASEPLFRPIQNLTTIGVAAARAHFCWIELLLKRKRARVGE